MRSAVLVILIVIASGCGARREYLATEVTIDRTGWDTLAVQVGFQEKELFGEPRPAVTDSFEVRLFSAGFDTLYVGHDSLVVVPDRALNDRERLLVEACGYFGRQIVCSQRTVEASPKRVTVASELEYPENGDYDIGKYSFTFEAERQVYGSDAWEPVRMPAAAGSRLSVRVLGEGSEPITVPLPSRRGEFRMTNLPNNADFRRDLLAQLLDADEATVRFELFSSAFAIRAPVWVSDTVVESKTVETRDLEAGYFVQEAGARLLDLLRTFPVGPNVYLFMDRWEFDRDERMYTIVFSLSWQSSFLRSRWFQITGELHVREDGSSPIIRYVDGNERGERRWEQRFGSPEVELGAVRPMPGSRANDDDDED